jgi:hypothetical protein
MSKKEASARLKINSMLQDAGWRLFDDSLIRMIYEFKDDSLILPLRICDVNSSTIEISFMSIIFFNLVSELCFNFSR